MDFSNILSRIPLDNILEILTFAAVFCGCLIIFGLLARLLLGRDSALNHAISCTLEMLLIYAASALIHVFNPFGLRRFLSPLPFVSFSGSAMQLFSFTGVTLPVLSAELLSAVILAFLVNLIDHKISKGGNTVGWIFNRLLSLLAVLALNFICWWLLNLITPNLMAGYAPMILMGILAFLFALGALKFLLSLLLIAVNPLLAAVYAFFSSGKLGKQISKALFTSLMITAAFYTLETLGISSLPLAPDTLTGYGPAALVLLIVWYIIGYRL